MHVAAQFCGGGHQLPHAHVRCPSIQRTHRQGGKK
jgi:hypothetical protein